MRIFILILGMFILGCSNTNTPISVLPKVEKQSPSLVPSVIKTQDNIDKINKENIKLTEQIKDQKNEIIKQASEIDEAIASAERLKEQSLAQKALDEIEAAKLLGILSKVKQSNTLLNNKVSELEETTRAQAEFLELSRSDARQLMLQVEIYQKEKEKLLNDYKLAQSIANEQAKHINNIEKQNINLTKKYATAGVYRNWVIGFASFVIIGLIIYIIIKNKGFIL